MDIQEHKEALYHFLSEYADFFEEMAAAENDKLGALLSNSLPAIERSITVQQATEKRLENLERRRVELQAAAGVEDKTFHEIIGLAPKEQKQKLQLLFNRVEQAISQIKYLNGKSMGVARSNIQALSAQPQGPAKAGAKGYSQSGGQNAADNLQGGTLLKTKV